MIDLRYGNSTATTMGASLRSTTLLCAAGALLSCLACSSDSNDGHPNYYLSGRVLDGSTLEPIANAPVSLNVGNSSKQTRSKADGSFSVGPIAPDSDYRISAQLTGYGDFAFYGNQLPHLENFIDRDRALVGDVVLYKDDQKSPAFTINASSRDARLPLDTASAEARFLPVRLGTDPAARLAAASDPDADSAPQNQADTWLPNSALSDLTGYRARIVDGKAAVPEGALRWGAGYNLEVYGGPSFEPESMSFAAGRAADMDVWLSPSPTALSTDLAQGTSEYFTGRIYDGVSLDRLKDYSVRLEYFDRVIPGTVDDNGRYFVGPLLADADYSIVVVAEGYRSFLSHNERIAKTTEESLQSLYYDAFLYPEQVSTPGATCRVRVSDSTDLPSGFMRFSPTSSSALFDPADTAVGVTTTSHVRQLWDNDDDLQQRALTIPFQNGEASLASGQLVYGVTYAVTIYGVPGHEPSTGTFFTAGVDGDRSWVMDPLSDTDLAITALSSDDLAPLPNGDLTIRFNQPIALDPHMSAATAQRMLNDSFSISAPNTDADAEQNVLVDSAALTPPVQPGYRGVTFEIHDDELVLHWNRTLGLATTDSDEPVLSVTYGGLDQLLVYPAGTANATPVDVLSLFGSGTPTVRLVSQ